MTKSATIGGWLLRLRFWRRVIARPLVVAFLLPVLLGLIPAAPLTAEEALAQAIATSVCHGYGQDGSGQNDPSHTPVQHDQCCVLCAIHCGVTPAASLVTAAVATPWQALGGEELDVPHTPPQRPALWRSVIIPRGPPAA